MDAMFCFQVIAMSLGPQATMVRERQLMMYSCHQAQFAGDDDVFKTDSDGHEDDNSDNVSHNHALACMLLCLRWC